MARYPDEELPDFSDVLGGSSSSDVLGGSSMFDPLARQRADARNVRRKTANTSIPSSAIETPPPVTGPTVSEFQAWRATQGPNSQPATGLPANSPIPPDLAAEIDAKGRAQAAAPYTGPNPATNFPKTTADVRQQGLDAMLKAQLQATQMPDMSQQVEQYRRGYEGAGPDMAFAMFMGNRGGKMGEAMGGQVLKQALAAREPQKTEFGTIDYAGGFTPDQFKQRAFEVQRLESMAKYYETVAHNADTIEQRRDAQRLADEAKRRHDELIAALKGGADHKLKEAGVAPDGRQVSYDAQTGQRIVVNPDGKREVYNGPMLSQAHFDKQIEAVQKSLFAMNNLRTIDQMVKANPNAFGGVASLSSLTPQIIASRWQSAKLTPQERETRALVMTQAAQVINDLYGAAVSAGEMARAMAFVPTNLDDPATVGIKLKAAMEWANSHASMYGHMVRGAAESRNAPGAQQPGGPISFKDYAAGQGGR